MSSSIKKKIYQQLEKVKYTLKQEGLFILIRRIIYSFSYNEIWANNLNDNKINCSVHNIKLKVIEKVDEFEKLLSKGYNLFWYEMSTEQCINRLNKGAIMFLTTIDKDISHISWVGTNNKSHLEFYYSPINFKYEASIGGTMTYSKYRGKGIYTWVYNEIFRYLNKGGYSKALLEVDINNEIVKRTQIKFGSCKIGERCRLRIIVFHFNWIKQKKINNHRKYSYKKLLHPNRIEKKIS